MRLIPMRLSLGERLTKGICYELESEHDHWNLNKLSGSLCIHSGVVNQFISLCKSL